MTKQEEWSRKILDKVLEIEAAKEFFYGRDIGSVVELENASEQLIQLKNEIEDSSWWASITPDFLKQIKWENQYYKTIEEVSVLLSQYAMSEVSIPIKKGKSLADINKGTGYFNIGGYSTKLNEMALAKIKGINDISALSEACIYEMQDLSGVGKSDNIVTKQEEWQRPIVRNGPRH